MTLNSRLDYEQQQLEEERMLFLLVILQKVKRAGLESEAMELAGALGLTTFYKEQSNGKGQ